MKWYPPLFISIACAGVFGFTWQWITLKNPKKALSAIFWLSPLLTCAMAIMLVYIESPISLIIGCGVMMDPSVALNDTLKYFIGSVSIGSILVPFISTFRGFARSIKIAGGDSDEFMFSCVSCYMGIASILVSCGNRVGLVQLIDLDLTGSFCFFSGVAGGAISSLVSGIWSIVLDKNYATELSIYGFLIGYFMVRLALACPQACVSAYYVAYAENPQSTHFDSTIPMRLEQLQRSQV
ncbi:plasma-membrane choline transporter family protein [Medicago truncatula]|uniref:Plasma-membrane choline transporter family protein n=1 Tax=Medicago truncatula TaxID=3880 RepID=A0A072UIA2_MEDTR|nr:plasma-membrane choline transporter family protein [Medicago truncatula]